MKGKRLAALGLALSLMLSLLVVPAGAVSFTDMTGHWAKEDVEYLADQGIINGTSATTFAPDQKMTACEALLFCSRATGVSSTDKADIAAAWADELETLLPAEIYSWAAEEMAVCLETGILSETELQALSSSGGLVKSITRENLAMYLVRAMQLEPLAKSLTSYPMSFADATSISAALQPYVYLLNMYGIVKGNESNQFLPQESLTRAEMATMLRRAIDFMDDRGIYAELPAYTTYDWLGGTVAAVTTGTSGVTLLTLSSPLTGTHSIALPSGTAIYENNMLTTDTALKVGSYARVNLNTDGSAASVRLGGALTSYTGTVSSVAEDNVTILVDSQSISLDVDRFTEVQVGGVNGDYTLIDLQAGYTTATAYVDAMGHLAGIQLSGGTRAEEGLLQSVVSTTTGQTITLSAFNGETRSYTVPIGAGITVNGVSGSIITSYVGDYVSLRVSNDDGQVVSAAVDTLTKYVQGVVRTYTTTKDVNTITMESLTTGGQTTYYLSENVVIRYDGEVIKPYDLDRGAFATLQFSGSSVTLVDAYPDTTTTEGVIESIVYGSPTTLSVRTSADSLVTFEIDLSSLPTVYRNGNVSSIDQIRSGDQVEVTVRYNQVTELKTTSQSANVTGTITRVVQDASGITIDVTLSDGTEESYAVDEGVSVTQDGDVISLYALKPNDQVAMVVSGSQVVSIELDKSASNSTQMEGTVLVPNTDAKTLMIQLSSGTAITVDVSGARFMSSTGDTLSLSKLEVGQRVQIYGSYSGAKFQATLVISL